MINGYYVSIRTCTSKLNHARFLIAQLFFNQNKKETKDTKRKLKLISQKRCNGFFSETTKR